MNKKILIGLVIVLAIAVFVVAQSQYELNLNTFKEGHMYHKRGKC